MAGSIREIREESRDIEEAEINTFNFVKVTAHLLKKSMFLAFFVCVMIDSNRTMLHPVR